MGSEETHNKGPGDEDTTAEQSGVISSEKRNDDKNKMDIPRGMPKSGKFWKSTKERFSSLYKKNLRQDFKMKTALRLDLKRTKELAKQAQELLKQKELDRKELRRQNIKRSEENKRKAEVVQVITNTTKLKRMKKKQMRFIQKRDTNKEAGTVNKK